MYKKLVLFMCDVLLFGICILGIILAWNCQYMPLYGKIIATISFICFPIYCKIFSNGNKKINKAIKKNFKEIMDNEKAIKEIIEKIEVENNGNK